MFGNLFYNIDAETLILGLLFIIFFVLIQLVLSRSLKDKSSASIIAFCVALLAVFGISKTGFNLSDFSYNLGINEDILYNVIPIIILAGLIFLFWKVKVRFILVILGLLLMVGSFFVYEKTVVLIIGIVILLFGIILMIREARRKVNKGYYIRR